MLPLTFAFNKMSLPLTVQTPSRFRLLSLSFRLVCASLYRKTSAIWIGRAPSQAIPVHEKLCACSILPRARIELLKPLFCHLYHGLSVLQAGNRLCLRWACTDPFKVKLCSIGDNHTLERLCHFHWVQRTTNRNTPSYTFSSPPHSLPNTTATMKQTSSRKQNVPWL